MLYIYLFENIFLQLDTCNKQNPLETVSIM